VHYLPVAEAAAQSLAIKQIAASVHDDDEIESVISSLAGEPGGGLVVLPDVYVAVHRASIISAAARNNVPAVYDASFFVRDGGLLGYGPDEPDILQRAASYVGRIL
jgi:putative ABC transport system substrate-binding protein